MKLTKKLAEILYKSFEVKLIEITKYTGCKFCRLSVGKMGEAKIESSLIDPNIWGHKYKT